MVGFIKGRLTFDPKYFVYTIVLLVIEILIAIYVKDDFVRPYLGDTLVVMLIYCFLRTFVKTDTISAVIIVLLFAFLVEYLQHLDLVGKAQIKSKVLRVVLGSSFSWYDIIAYLAGGIIIAIVERLNNKTS